MKKIILLFAVLVTVNLTAQDKKEKDVAAIKKFCGCYEVSFNFSETFSYSKDKNYKPSKTKHDGALEWVQLAEETDNKLVLQHLLIINMLDTSYIIKHWRQDWLYENTDFYMFNADNKWLFQQKTKSEVAGQWTQKVFQVDDSPRYEGSATWVHVDGKSFWENKTDAPLPRREYTIRNDYNVTVRRNRQEITSKGWVHDQDNDKLIRKKGKKDFVLAQEKGYNYYKKVDDSKCKLAQDWWVKNRLKWLAVRNHWAQIFARNKDLKLRLKVDDRFLYEKLFLNKVKASEVDKVINEYVK